MRNWFRPRSVRPQRPPVRFQSPFRKLSLDRLEDRVVPAQQYLSLGNLLTFYGDFDGPTGSDGATIYTGVSATSTDDAVQIGPYVANTADFAPALQVEGGTVVFDTNPDTNKNLDFIVSGEVVSVLPNPYIPQNTTLATVTTKQTNANDFVSGGFSLTAPYNSADTTGLSSGDVIPGTFFVTINSIGIATSPTFGGAAIAIEGQVAVNIPGGNKPIFEPPAGTPPADQITLAANAGDAFYLTDASPYGFDIGGASIAITDTFTYNGLTIAANGLTFDIQPGGDTFEIYGGVTISTSAKQGSDFSLSAAANFGTVSDPGLTFNWSTDEIEEFDLGITGDFKLGALEVQAKDLSVAYDSTTNVLAISGSVSLALQGYTFSAGLTGPDGSPGLTIDRTTGQVDFDGLQLSLSNFNLGFFSISKASLTFSDSNNNLDLAGALALTFPGGWGAGGSFEFSYSAAGGFELEEIGVAIAGAVPVGTTGVFVTYISGELDGLGTQNWSVSGSVGVAFGEPVTIQGKSVRIVQAVGGFTLDRNELVLSGSVGFGAVVNAQNQITSNLLGILDGNITLDWADEIYSASVNGSFLDGTFTLAGDFQYSPGHFSFLATAGVNVPNGIPVIGGDPLISASFAFEYNDNGGNATGFLAAWTHIPIIGNAGLAYDIQTGDFSFIGNSVIPVQVLSHTFTIPEFAPGDPPPAGASSASFLVQFVPSDLANDDWTVSLSTPGGVTTTLINGLAQPPNQAVAGIQASPTDSTATALPWGSYTLTLTIKKGSLIDPNSVVWTGLAGYVVPSETTALTPSLSGSTLTATQQVTLDSAFVSQGATASLYLDTDDSGYNGARIASTTTFTPGGDPFSGVYTIDFSVDLAPLNLTPGTYYLYVVLDDGVNPPQTTNYSAGFAPQPPLTGYVIDIGDSRNRPLSGWTVFIDQNGNGVYDAPVFDSNGNLISPGDPSDVTNAAGAYAFYNDTDPATPLTFTAGTEYTVGFVLPPAGYDLSPNGSTTTTFTYEGVTWNFNFQVLQQATVAGTVFNDLNGNGMPDPGEGVGGVSVYLDLNNNDVLDADEPNTSSLNDGTYEFIGGAPDQLNLTYTVHYVLPADYLASGGPSTYSVPVGTDGYARYDGNTFAIVAEATISGTVTGNNIFGGQLGTAAPLAGWTIQLLDSNGNVVATTTSDLNGNYAFTGLLPGNYTVREQVPSGWQQVAPYTTTPSLAPTFTGTGPGDPIRAVTVADFNNDGNLDYALWSDPYKLIWAYGNGDGTFGGGGTYDTYDVPEVGGASTQPSTCRPATSTAMAMPTC